MDQGRSGVARLKVAGVTARVHEAPQYTPQARAERLIALGRLVLACFSLLAVYLEPSTPAKYQQATYALLAAYTLYALVVLVVAWRTPVPPARQRVASHVVDLILFTLFIYLTEGPASPFFLYFIFSLFCATLRFPWRGIVATGAAAMLIYGAMGAGALLLADPHFELSRFAVRIAYLGVITALLAYLGVYQEQLRSELASLAAWPRQPANELDAVLRQSLAHASEILRSPRVLFVWEEPEEPWVYTALRTPQSFRIERAAPGRYDFGPAEGAVSFLARSASAMVFDPQAHTVSELKIDPVGSVIRNEHGLETTVGVIFDSDGLKGRIFALDATSATVDDLVLAHIVGRLLLASLDQLFFVQQVRQTAGVEERLRIARDLHDGIIQSLSGVGLQLQSIRATTTPQAAQRIAEVQAILEAEQRELRELVRELRPHDGRSDSAADLRKRLQQLVQRFLLEWGLSVSMQTSIAAPLAPDVALEIYRIVNESLSNAARHGKATRANVEVTVAVRSCGIEAAVNIRVTDNGRGFGFAGRRDLPALDQFEQGPRTLKERVRNLRGTLVVDSSPAGAAIEASFPIPAEARG